MRPSLEQPLLYERVNVQGTLVLLELARLFGVKKFVFASSSSIYGVTSKTPFAETEANPNPISPYGVTKLAGEKVCYCYTHLYRIPTVCLRFFTVYGPRQRPDLAIHKFVTLIHEGREISVFGDGSSLRDYTFVDDIVDGILATLEFDCQHEVFNLGNSNPISLIEMIRLAGEVFGQKRSPSFRGKSTWRHALHTRRPEKGIAASYATSQRFPLRRALPALSTGFSRTFSRIRDLRHARRLQGCNLEFQILFHNQRLLVSIDRVRTSQSKRSDYSIESLTFLRNHLISSRSSSLLRFLRDKNWSN